MFRKVTVNSDFLILFSFGMLDLCNNNNNKKLCSLNNKKKINMQTYRQDSPSLGFRTFHRGRVLVAFTGRNKPGGLG